MRLSLALVCLLPSLAFAQPTAARKKETIKWITDHQSPAGGFYLFPRGINDDAKRQPMLRATSDAVRALKGLSAEVPNKEKHAAFVLSCYDPKTGGFAEPGGKPDVTITSIGVMAAAELGIPHDKYAKAMGYLKENAKTFEEVRIGAAAVEAWGVKDCPFKLDGWLTIAGRDVMEAEEIKKRFDTKTLAKDGRLPIEWALLTLLTERPQGSAKAWAQDGGSRVIGSFSAMHIRLGRSALDPDQPFQERKPKPEPKPEPKPGRFLDLSALEFDFSDAMMVGESILAPGQREDGGWSKKGEKASDIETTYHVMRALMLLKVKPENVEKLREFVQGHRTYTGSYAMTSTNTSNMSGVYYCVSVLKWLDDLEAMEAKK